MSSHGAGTAIPLDALGAVCVPGERIDELVARLLSFGGRFPEIEAHTVLSLEARALLAGVGRAATRPGPAPAGHAGAVAHVAVFPYGRPWLSLSPPPPGETQPLGWAPVGTEPARAVLAERGRLEHLRERADEEMDTFFARLGTQEIRAILAEAADHVDHNDPVLLYVDDELFTNFDRFNNLLPRLGAPAAPEHQLHHLLAAPSPVLSVGQRRLAYGLHLLRRARLRAEEFCGRQLAPWNVRTYFANKYEQYTALGAWSSRPRPMDLAHQASELAQLKQTLQATHQAYRLVNGLSFHKEERWRPRAPTPAVAVPAAVWAHCQAQFGLDETLAADRETCFRAVVEALEPRSPEARSAALGALLDTLVRDAMRAVPSPVGMTRGVRDLAHFQRAVAENRENELCAAPLDDGYCAVFARPDFATLCAPQPVARVLAAISRRMQFNHWHYTPGYFGAAARPPDRHFYYPPDTGDIATAEEHRHSGHALARVRHSIRSPATLRVAGRAFSGLVDIRLMRATGRPYTEADLVAVADYTDLLRALAQAILDHAGQGSPTPVITGFDRWYYERQYPAGGPPPTTFTARVCSSPSVGAMVRAALDDHAGSASIVCGTTGRVFHPRVVQQAAHALAQSLPPGERLALLCTDRAHQALGVLAGLAAGLVVCPLDPGAPAEGLSRTLRHLAPRAVLVDTDPGAVLVGEPITLASILRPGQRQRPAVDAAAEGLVIYTSGTTGIPRGVCLDGRHLGANVAFAQSHFAYDAEWTAACVLPLHHSFALLSDLLPVFCSGGTVVVMPGFSPGQVAAFGDALGHHRVQSYSAVPLVFDTLVAAGANLPPSLRFAISGAAPLAERTRLRYHERHRHPVLPCYGLTESTCFATASPLRAVRPGSSGIAANIDLRVVGGDLQPLPAGERGEIAIRGPSVITEGYFQQSGARDECFADDGWFLTGDLGHLDGDGYLFVTGRSKDVVVRGGDKLYLDDLDRCLLGLPGVTDACSARVPGWGGIERAVAFLVGRPVSDEVVRAQARLGLGPVGVPDEVRWVDRVPRGATGKPLRDVLVHQHRISR